MPRGPAPPWRQRKQPVRDDYVMASIHQAGGRHHPTTGHYAILVIEGCATREEAQEEIRALHRSAMYLSKWQLKDAIGVSAKIRKRDGKYDVHFHAIDKAFARKYIIDTYGADPSKWPYDPRRRGAQ